VSATRHAMLLCLAAGAASPAPRAAAQRTASAELREADGRAVGRVVVASSGGALRVSAELRDVETRLEDGSSAVLVELSGRRVACGVLRLGGPDRSGSPRRIRRSGVGWRQTV
jgi:Cu/Zn superoxide dismutase